MGRGPVRSPAGGVIRGSSAVELDVSWDELNLLTRGGGGDQVASYRRNALRVLGARRGALVLVELDAGRTPRLRPVRK
jgi:hypothetical protein